MILPTEKKLVPYWQNNRQPFPTEHEQNIAWSAITKASRKWLREK